MALKIEIEQVELIEREAEHGFPHEICGYLLGHQRGDEVYVTAILQGRNSRENNVRHHRYLMTADEYRRCDAYARQRDLDIVGFYHSHPGAPARPSQNDLENGTWPGYVYLIVSVIEKKVREARAWRLDDDYSKFVEEELYIIEEQEKIHVS